MGTAASTSSKSATRVLTLGVGLFRRGDRANVVTIAENTTTAVVMSQKCVTTVKTGVAEHTSREGHVNAAIIARSKGTAAVML